MTGSLGQTVRRALGVRLGVLEQHSPIAFKTLSLPPSPEITAASPRIGLVTPSLNQGRFIGRTVTSVLSQEYPALDYIIQDGGSSDGTARMLAGFGACVNVVYEPDSGLSDAINRGFARTDAPIMGWLNSDDLHLPGTLARIAQVFETHSEVDVVYGNRLVIDESDRIIGAWVLPRHDAMVLRRVDYVPQETLFWRRSAWERVGATIDESLAFAVDWDLLLRFLNAGCRFLHLPVFLGAFRVHRGQKTSSAFSTTGRAEIAKLRAREGRPSFAAYLAHSTFLFDHRQAHRRAWAEIAQKDAPA